MFYNDNLSSVAPANDIMQDSLYGILAKASPGLALITDNSCSKLLYYDARFVERMGYTPAELEDASFAFTDLLEAHERERFFVHMQHVTQYPELKNRYGVYQLKNKAGEAMIWYVYADPINVPGREDSCYHLYLLPELLLRSVPFQSADSRELFFQQFEQFEFGTYEWILETGRVFWSEGIYDIYELDRSRQDLTYDVIQQFRHPADSERAAAILKHALDTGGDFHFEMKIITVSQKVKTICSMGKVVLSKDGRPIKLTGSIRDITKQKQIEYDLQRNIEELSRSNKELEEFAYVASHDLQEPLRKITTFCGRLAEKYGAVLTGEGSMYMERMTASAENMRMLINNLLEFSRITRNAQPFEDVSLNFILHQVKSDLELSIEENKVTIEAGKLPYVEASASQMKQLFSNIINNAIKFRKADVAPHIAIKCVSLSKEDKEAYKLPGNNDYYKITIADNGIGFDNEYSNKIFQIFQRLNGKADYPGSGIGLAICKKIADHHRGLIFAEGVEGSGAQFTIILPVKQYESN